MIYKFITLLTVCNGGIMFFVKNGMFFVQMPASLFARLSLNYKFNILRVSKLVVNSYQISVFLCVYNSLFWSYVGFLKFGLFEVNHFYHAVSEFTVHRNILKDGHAKNHETFPQWERTDGLR
jgi:hypothetical protein